MDNPFPITDPLRQKLFTMAVTADLRPINGLLPNFFGSGAGATGLTEILSHIKLTTVVLSPTLVSDDYAPQRAGHASLPGPTAPSVTELLPLPVPGYGTVYCHISEMLTYHTVSSGGH